jgi:hypothetical protein
MRSKTTEICIYEPREVIVSLVKNQRSERNSDDVQKLVLEQNKGHHDHNRGLAKDTNAVFLSKPDGTWPGRIWAM